MVSQQSYIALDRLIADIRVMEAESNFDDFADLDQRCRDVVSKAVLEAEEGDLALHKALQDILALYTKMTRVSERRREEAANKIRNIHKSAEGLKSYIDAADQR